MQFRSLQGFSIVHIRSRTLGAVRTFNGQFRGMCLPFDGIFLANCDFQVFRFLDRKESRFLLAPTHEEEITTLVGSLAKSYRDLPLRVYQICEFSWLK